MAATPPLSPHVPIADEQGRPTPQFIQWWTEQRGVNNLIIPLTNTSEVSAVLDLLGDTPGAILTRGAAGWQMIVPGATGEVLTSAGPGAVPAWAAIPLPPPPSFLTLPDTPADYTGAAGYVVTVNANEDGLVFAPGGGGGGGHSPHRYWRIYISANNGDSTYSAMVGVQFLDGSSVNLVGSGVAAASSEYAGFGAALAFAPWTSDSVNYWSPAANSAVPSWVSYDFLVPVLPEKITMTGVRLAARMPKDFIIEWSDDGSTWTTSNAHTGVTGWGIGGTDTRTFDVYP